MIIIFGFLVNPIPRWHHCEVLASLDVIVVQSKGTVKLYPSPKGSSSRQEIINLLLMAARTLAPSLLAWNVMEQLVLLHVFICADIADYASVGIVIVVMSLHSFAMARHEGMACHLSDIADGSV